MTHLCLWQEVDATLTHLCLWREVDATLTHLCLWREVDATLAGADERVEDSLLLPLPLLVQTLPVTSLGLLKRLKNETATSLHTTAARLTKSTVKNAHLHNT